MNSYYYDLLQKHINTHTEHVLCNLSKYPLDTDTLDQEGLLTRLQVVDNAVFESNDDRYNRKLFRGYNLIPEKTTSIQSMEVIVLKSFLTEILGAVIV